jgi:hypothetical protein
MAWATGRATAVVYRAGTLVSRPRAPYSGTRRLACDPWPVSQALAETRVRGILSACWGFSPLAAKAEALAARQAVLRLVRIEDAFSALYRCRGRAGRRKRWAIGADDRSHRRRALSIRGTPSTLETLLATDPLDDSGLAGPRPRRDGADGRRRDLSKYNLHDPALPGPPPGYVLVVDQTREDAARLHAGQCQAAARSARCCFARRMITRCRRIVIRSPSRNHRWSCAPGISAPRMLQGRHQPVDRCGGTACAAGRCDCGLYCQLATRVRGDSGRPSPARFSAARFMPAGG